jgi:hypothetical protein
MHYRFLLAKPEGKRPLERSRRKWEDNIKINVKEIGWENMNWIRFPQVREKWRAVVNTVTNLQVP